VEALDLDTPLETPKMKSKNDSMTTDNKTKFTRNADSEMNMEKLKVFESDSDFATEEENKGEHSYGTEIQQNPYSINSSVDPNAKRQSKQLFKSAINTSHNSGGSS
jgi:septin family protein